MMPQPPRPMPMSAEKVAYWYLRLNGFFQIENFVVHPSGRGGQRTDADLLAVRFPHRAERLFDNPQDIMADDEAGLSLSQDRIDVMIAEVKTSSPCTLNGPWTRPEDENVHRVLAAIGCLPPDRIAAAATSIYATGAYDGEPGLRVRLVAIGARERPELRLDYPAVCQVTWPELLRFIWQRFHDYRRQKRQIQQWDAEGRRLKRWADQERTPERLVEVVLERMGVRQDRA